jgi:hypothetical protein
MFNFRPSASQRLYYSPPFHSVYPNDFLYSPYPSSHSPVNDAEFRYFRAISEYLVAEEEYDAMIRAREKAALEARAEVLRRERARLLQARIARAREERQEWQLERALAEALSRTAVSSKDEGDPSGSHTIIPIPIKRGVPGRALSDTLLVAPRLYAHAHRSLGTGACSEKKKCDCVPQPLVEKKVRRASFIWPAVCSACGADFTFSGSSAGRCGGISPCKSTASPPLQSPRAGRSLCARFRVCSPRTFTEDRR